MIARGNSCSAMLLPIAAIGGEYRVCYSLVSDDAHAWKYLPHFAIQAEDLS